MTYTYFHEPAFNCCFVRFDGELVSGEVMAQMKEAMASASWVVGINILQDFRHADLPYAGYGHFAMVQEQRDAIDRDLGPCRIAFIAGSKAQFGTLRQLAMMSPEQPVERAVFMDMRSAKAWLGVPESFRVVYPATPA